MWASKQKLIIHHHIQVSRIHGPAKAGRPLPQCRGMSVEGDEERGHPYKRRGGGWDRRLMSGKPGKGITFEI